MSNVPQELRYTKSHEWVRPMDDGTVVIGITDHAQDLLGDMVFVETPAVGREVTAGEDCAVVESVKAASDVYSPLAGEVVESNESLSDAPERVNQDPYGEGWLFRLRPSDADALAQLMDADAYTALVAAESH
ncbi:glycine cleavage system protein GcvH [Ectothiorhodospiraceae bacterium 2226]|nr:glycine cleavage system protein GcvH [Ectothiorhodospiraceae bacterium 2226]